MWISIILGRRDSSNCVEVVSGPLPANQQNAKFKQLACTDGNGLSEMYLHELDPKGGRKRKKFKNAGTLRQPPTRDEMWQATLNARSKKTQTKRPRPW
jgi:hypothetical protein